MDLWEKYDVHSIHGHQYYLLFVDDATWYITLNFLKSKQETAQCVKNYLIYLHICSNHTHAICVDRGSEFINNDLKQWYQQKGIEIELTALYSLSQNGVVKHMNRILTELVCTMLRASKLLEFLWEPAIAHAVYVWNCTYCILCLLKIRLHMRDGSEISQMFLICMNSECLSGSYLKIRIRPERSSLNCIGMHL